MDAQDPNTDPTADYRKYPKSPSFLRVVILSATAFLIILALALWLVSNHGRHLIPHRPTATPNSLVQPRNPPSALSA